MKLQIHAPGVDVTPEVYSYAERRIQFALGRFSPRITRLDLYLSDENGPQRGGVDKSCRLIVKLSPDGMLAVQDCDADLRTLINRAVERLARSVQRELERRHTQRVRSLWENG